MKNMMNWIANEEEGQGMVEYALILALVSIVAIFALTSLGGSVRDKFSAIGTELEGATVGEGSTT